MARGVLRADKTIIVRDAVTARLAADALLVSGALIRPIADILLKTGINVDSAEFYPAHSVSILCCASD